MRRVAAALLVLVAAAAIVIAVGESGPGAGQAAGWERLPGPPFLRSGSATVWTGRSLVVWGGAARGGSSEADGAIFDAQARSWRAIPRAPLAGRMNAGVVWTGSLLIVWGGQGRGRAFADGAMFDPQTETWHVLPQAPLAGRSPVVAVWLRDRFVVWGDRARFGEVVDGAAFDPAALTWTRLPPAPLALNEATGTVLDGKLFVYGAHLDDANVGGSPYADGMVYAPATRSWRVVRSYGLSPQASTVAAVGDRALVWDYLLHAALYDVRHDRWARVRPLPLRAAECYPSTAPARDGAVAWYCGQGAVFRSGTGTWQRFEPPASTLYAPVAADGRVLFLGEAVPAHTPQLWAYRPAP